MAMHSGHAGPYAEEDPDEVCVPQTKIVSLAILTASCRERSHTPGPISRLLPTLTCL